MTNLEKLYNSIRTLEELGLPLPKEVLQRADELEEQIIKDEILPSLSENIEPLLKPIQRDLVLVVEYHPGEPINVALSRKVKMISEIGGAKPLTPTSGRLSTPVTCPTPASSGSTECHEGPTKHVVNHTRGIRVTFSDGTAFCESNAFKTFVAVLKHIGLERVAKVGVFHAGYNLVSREMRPPQDGVVWQHQVDGYYIYSNISNQQKASDLTKISDYYHLGLKIETEKE